MDFKVVPVRVLGMHFGYVVTIDNVPYKTFMFHSKLENAYAYALGICNMKLKLTIEKAS